MKEYVFMSPVGNTRLYALDTFLEGVSKLKPSPSEIVFSVDSEFPEEALKDLKDFGNEVIVFPAESYPGSLARISRARELLRMWHLTSDYEFSFWLDSDIVVKPDLPKLLMEFQEKTKHVVVVHCYPGRPHGEENKGGAVVWHGSGIMLIHRVGAEVGRFLVTSANGMNISEDYNFFSLVQGAESILKYYFGLRGVAKICLTTEVYHYLEPDREPATVPPDRVNSMEYWVRVFTSD